MRFFLIIVVSCFCQFASLQVIAQDSVSQQINIIGVTINKDLTLFTEGLTRWGSGQMSDAASTILVKSSLIPASHRLNLNYTKTLNLAKRVPNEYGSTQVQSISSNGAVLFGDWQALLRKMVLLDSQKKQKELEAYAQKYMQNAILRTTQFIQQSTLISQQLQQNMNSYSFQQQRQPQVASGNSTAYDPELFRIMSEMQQSTHETNQAIINAMGPTPVDIYDSEGYFLYTE